jgi:hypothetical protein
MIRRLAFAYVFILVLMLLLAAILLPAPKAAHSGSGYTSGYSKTSGYRPRSTPRPTTKPAPKPTATPGTSRRSVLPGPSTEGFYHPEDFYEWNIDDFSDYEEAEEYYYSHGGW